MSVAENESVLIKVKKKRSKYDSRHYWNVFIVILAGAFSFRLVGYLLCDDFLSFPMTLR